MQRSYVFCDVLLLYVELCSFVVALSFAEGHNLRVSPKAYYWELGIESLICASGCDCQYVGQ